MPYIVSLLSLLSFSLVLSYSPYEPETKQCLSDIGLYPTGVDDDFVHLPVQSPQVRDTHWRICNSTIPEFSNCFGDGAPDLQGCCSSYSLPHLDTFFIHPVNFTSFKPSSWITWQGFGNHTGFANFSTTFQVEQDYECSLTLRIWVDNIIGRVSLNNEDIPHTFNIFHDAYENSDDFNLTASSGNHTLSFNVFDYGSIGGLLVTFESCSCVVPQPPTSIPTQQPTEPPTRTPTQQPTEMPSEPPTEAPSIATILCEEITCLQCNDTDQGCSFDGDYLIPSDQDSPLIVSKPTIINGDLTNSGNVILVLGQTENLLNVSGCVSILPNSSLSIDVSNVDKSSDKRIDVIISPCFNGSAEIINQANECADVKPEQHSRGLAILIDTSDCSNNVGIIVGATVGAVVLAVLLFILVAFLVPGVRRAVLPWNLIEMTTDPSLEG